MKKRFLSQHPEYSYYRYHGKTPEQKAAFLEKLRKSVAAKRAKWTPNEWEQFHTKRRSYYSRVLRYKMRGKKQCPICGVKLASVFSPGRNLRYCDSCREDKDVRRYIQAWLTRRVEWRKRGWTPEPLMGTEKRKELYAIWKLDCESAKQFGRPLPPAPTANVSKRVKPLILAKEVDESIVNDEDAKKD